MSDAITSRTPLAGVLGPVRRAAIPVIRRWRRIAGWFAVGASGVLVNTGMLWLLASQVGVHYLWAACLATQVSSTYNFALVDRWVFPGAKRGTVAGRWLGFLTFSNAALLARIPALGLLVSVMEVNYLVANVATLILTFAVRFTAQERLSLHKGETCPTPSTAA